MGLFDKKYCDVCGDKIGLDLFGGRKLEDGHICKKCTAKLSPWFNEKRHSSVAQIKEQLAYREENQSAVADFRLSRSLGDGSTKVLIDEDHHTFAIAAPSAMNGGNPDIIDASLFRSCTVKPTEHRTELKTKNSEGKMVSYDPPRYEYSYDFYATITTSHPYADEMEFRLNSTTVRIRNGAQYGSYSGPLGALTARRNQSLDSEYDSYLRMGDEIQEALRTLRDGQTAAASAASSAFEGQAASAAASAENAAPAAAEPVKIEWICPYCDTKNTGKFCTACGAKKE